VFPPSDSNSLDNSNDDANGKGNPASMGDDRRGRDELMPLHGGMNPHGNMPWGYGFPTRPEILSASPNFANLLHSFRRRKWLAIFFGLVLGGSLAGLAWFYLPTKYESAALLQVKVANPSIWNQESGSDWELYKRNALAQIKGELVINKALEDKGLLDLPVIKENSADLTNWLQEALIVDYPQNGELMRVAIRNEDPKGLDLIVSAVVEAFMKETVGKERTDKLAKYDDLDKKFRAYKQEVLDKQRQLYELNKSIESIGTNDAESAKVKYKMELNTLDSFMQTRSDIQKQIFDISLKADMAALMKKNAENNNIPETDIEAAVSRDPRIQQASNELAELTRAQHEVERSVTHKTDPAAVRIRDQIAGVRQTMDEIKNEDRQQVIELYKNQGDSNSSAMLALNLEKNLLIEQYNKLSQQITAQADEVQKLEHFSGDADQLRADIDQRQALIRDMNNSLERWKIELDAQQRVTVMVPASSPVVVKPYQRAIATGFAGFVGFGLALFGVTFFEFQSRKLNAPHELIDGLGIRVMGDLPALRRRIGLRQRPRRITHGLVAESINSIRATLVRNSRLGSSNVFLVTSAGEQEGKTTVASQLAASLARSGRKTLLLDADLRHPGAHLVFGLDNEEGFCELLRDEAEVDEVIRPTPADHLWMVSAGRCDAVAVMALGKEAAAEVIGQLEARFEFIVIDTGPVLKVADALLLGPHVDGAILSVLRDVSRIHKVYEANERLKLAGVKVVGAVVNGIEDRGSFDRYHVVEAPAA
jgi:capsular exopolysaccharide synthesis family protein